jgi:hypothetical protein
MVFTRRNALFRRLTATAVLVIFTFLLQAAVQNIPPFTQNLYLPYSRAVSSGLALLFSFTSYAVAESLLVLAIAAGLFTLSRSIVRSLREKTAWPFAIWSSGVIASAAGIAFLFTLIWGGTYHAEKLETRLGLRREPQTEAILYKTAVKHLEDIIMYSEIVSADADGFEALAPEAARTVRSLMKADPEIFGNVPVARPKRAVSYPILTMLGISGIYSPFTGEAIVNTINTEPFLPSVMTHELAHRLGFAPEDDANFIAYLACMASDEPIFRYSGALMAFMYCYNALRSQDLRHELWSKLPQRTIRDFALNREAWQKYERPVLREIAANVNDAYLQTMGQEEGVKSYGLVTDLLIALYLLESDE